ncbi:phage head morphogenesis protein [Serratia aquatilis]|uniref:Phage head morphogenesis protein n=1 Tax=Serratia aquatilis TaxID=1737515 RepID=A0ABV6EES3_9GAMM
MATIPQHRRQPIRPVAQNRDLEKFYNGQLRGLIRLMASSVESALIPVLRRHYTADSFLTDLIKVALQQAAEQFFSSTLGDQYRRLAQTVVSRADSESSEAFVEQINRAIGIDMSQLMTRESLGDYFDASVESNVALIRSLTSDYFDDIQREVMDSILRGDSVTTLTRNLQHVTGATYRRAELIAVDQTVKIRSDITGRRQQSAGITRFRWSTSQDSRVSGNPVGKYPSAKIKCFVIARADVGYGPGVYLWSRGAQFNGETGLYPGRAHIRCRCGAIPQIQGLDYQ